MRECALAKTACPGEGLRCTDQTLNDDEYCACGYRGPLCSECAPGFFKSWAGETNCALCDETKGHVPGMVLGGVVLTLLVTIVVAGVKFKKKNSKDDAEKPPSKPSKIKMRLQSIASNARLIYKVAKVKRKEMILACQVISLFPDVLSDSSGRKTYPDAASTFSSSLGVTNLDVFSLIPFGCSEIFQISFYNALLVKTLAPMAVVALLWCYPLSCYVRNVPHDNAKQFAWKWSFLFLELILPSVTTTASQVWRSPSFGPSVVRRKAGALRTARVMQ